MQVILGAGGAISLPLALALDGRTDLVRLCSRSPVELPANTPSTRYEHLATDLLDPASTERAVEGAEVAYLIVGLPYETEVWRQQWPRLIEYVLAACAKTGTRLVFLDNVYAYAKTGFGDLHEDVPLDPPSAKGHIRKQVRERLLAAHAKGAVQVAVAVSADFYGPGISKSLLGEVIVKKLKAKQAAQWLIDADLPHSFTYTPDAGQHLALLGNDPRAYGQVWHLPTAAPAWTAREWTTAIASRLDTKLKLTVLPRLAWRMLGLFNGQMRELYDVRDQVAQPYHFNSDKFERTFGVRPTPYSEGVKQITAR